jgi:aspartyl-tRNA synthetase
MSFVEQEDILQTFEGLVKHLLQTVKGVNVDSIPRITYAEAMRRFGNDKPDIRFGMELFDLKQAITGSGFGVFESAEMVGGIAVTGCADYTRKQLDALTEWVKRPQIGMKGLVYCKYNTDGTLKSSVDKFFNEEALKGWAELAGAQPGDLLLVLAGDANITRKALSELRLYMAETLGLRKPEEFAPLWVLDFPLLEWDEETQRYHAMHHPFTSPKPEDLALLDTAPGKVRANAYDMVLNGNEIGGGSIRIHNRELQKRMFKLLGFSDEEAQKQFGFLMNAFEYGAPPHGGIAFGFDRLVALLGGDEVIRDYIAFPKNNAGRDVMIDAPATLAETQLDELKLKVNL